jgi:flagellin
MSRINTNISSLQAIHRLSQNQNELSLRLSRLSSGLKINRGADAPAGLIASETLRSEINGIRQAIDNAQRAGNVVNTAEGALSEVNSLLLEVQALNNQAANSGALSPQEIQANQLQVDTVLNSINRIANTTQFNGQKLLNGSLDYTTSGIATSALANTQINAAKYPENGTTQITVQVTASAKFGEIDFVGAAIGAQPTTIEIAGNDGTEQLSFANGTAASAVAFAINQVTPSTGVSAVASATGVRLTSTAFGSKQFVSVKTLAGAFANGKNNGKDAVVNVNGQKADVQGLHAAIRGANLDIALDLTQAFGQQTAATKNFYITGGGAKFQVGSEVNSPGQVNIGVGAVATTKLGDFVSGFLSSIASGGNNSLISGNNVAAQKILSLSIKQVAELRGRLGAFQKDILNSNVNSLNVALENVTASESSIRDADFAEETAALTRAQILVQANTSVLAQANASTQSVLTLLQR